MGKRKNKDPHYLKNKIRKLEEKLKRLPHHSQEDSEESTTPRSHSQQCASPILKEPSIPTKEMENNYTPTEEDLPEEFLLALGKEGEEIVKIGEPIRPELATRWAKLMTEGLGKEAINNIISKYPTPSNFINSIAPVMNPEILNTLSEIAIKRDKRIVSRQNLTGKLMTALGQALTNILKGNINSKSLIEQVNDAAKIAAEIHFQDSSSRKFFALSGASKTLQGAMKTSKIDKFLFGSDCGDKIKSAQYIRKTSIQIQTTKKVQQSVTTNKRGLNWKGPSQNYQQQRQQIRGGQNYQPYKRRPQLERPQQKGRTHPARFKTASRHYR